MKTLHELFLDQLADIYYAESRLVKALPKMAKAATQPEVKAAFEKHLQETRTHVTRLEKVFKAFGQKPKGKKCEAIVGLLAEGDELASEYRDSPASDAALICAAQKVEHYEMATYGCLREWADVLGESEAAEVLESTLEEEKAADDGLTELACSASNDEANAEEATPRGPLLQVRLGRGSRRRLSVRRD